ncbi:MAG: AmmeMemoRadiSam system protein A [Dehalococcoidia bacterium]
MAGIVFGCIVPHPPLLVPDVGGGREGEISQTTEAMERLTEQLARHRPETAFIISPHGAYYHNAMGVATAKSSQGNMRSWGARGPDYYFDNDLEAVAALEEEAKAANIPLRSIGERSYELDHGVLVPIYFLVKGMEGATLVPLTFSWLPLEAHFAFGQAIRRAAEKIGRRVAIIASGDLSHRLIPSAPAGYHPDGQVFDEKLTAAIEAYDVQAIMTLDAELVDRAGECGLRSIVILLGALEGLAVKPEVLSYEGPFGVGYLVASFEVENTTHPLARLAKETVESYVRAGKVPTPKELTPEMRERAGVFVSLKVRGMLRGCIGTFEPVKANVAEEIITNAVSSATRDPRFPPVTPAELSELDYSVDVLTKPEPVESKSDLDPKRYGVIVECGGRRGLLLPDLEGVNTVEDQIDICRSKAGILPHEPVKLYRFEVRRYK